MSYVDLTEALRAQLNRTIDRYEAFADLSIRIAWSSLPDCYMDWIDDEMDMLWWRIRDLEHVGIWPYPIFYWKN